MRRLAIVLLVVAALAVAADFAARKVAENRVAAMAQSRLHSAVEPDVTVHGFPFLTQVLSHRLTSVTISVPTLRSTAVTGTDLRVTHLRATFRDVRLSSDFSAARAGSVVGVATIPYASLGSLGEVHASYAGRSATGVGLVAIRPVGVTLPYSLKVGVVLEGRRRVAFVGPDATTRLPARAMSMLGGALLRSHPLSGLPHGFMVRSLHVTPQGITVRLTAHHLALAN